MFNRFRKTLRDRETSVSGSPRLQNLDDTNTVEQSGFICPMCMTNLQSPEDLQRHFEVAHPSPDQPDPKPHHPAKDPPASDHNEIIHNDIVDKTRNKTKTDTNGITETKNSTSEHSDTSFEDSSSLREEINDLKSSLNEEKWFSGELKKEMETLQIEKNKISVDYETLQKQLGIAVATNDELAKQKQTLERKAMNMSQSIADIKASKDELQSEKIAIEERCQNQIVELEKAATWVRDLESQLLQRPGADDVMVLKKELVSVQTLMDQMTLESEKKGKEVEDERQNLQQLLDEARKQAEVVQAEFDLFKDENVRLKSKNEETAAEKHESMKQYEHEKDELNKLHSEKDNTRQEELSNIQASLEKEQLYSQSLELESNRLQEDKVAMKEDIKRLSEELDDLLKLSEKEKSRFEEISNKLNEAEKSKTETENNFSNIKEQLERFQVEREAEVTERNARIDALACERDDIQTQLTSTQNQLQNNQQKHETLNREYEELRQQYKDSEVGNTATRQQLEVQLAQFQIKMEALETDNVQILEQKKSVELNIERMRHDHNDERNSIQTKLLETEHQLISLRLKSDKIEEEKLQTSKYLEESDKKLSSTRQDYEEAKEKAYLFNANLTLKLQEIDALKEKLSQTTGKLEEEIVRRERATEESTKLREERTHLMGQMEVGEGEAAARAQLAQENEELRRQKEEAEEKLRQEISDHESIVSNLSIKLSDANTLLVSTQEQNEMSQQFLEKLKEEIATGKEKLVVAEADLKTKCELLATVQASSITQRTDIENHLNTVKRSLEDKIKELQKCSEELNTSRSAVDGMKIQMNQLRQDNHIEVSNVRNELDKTEGETKEALEDVDKLTKELVNLKEEKITEFEQRREEVYNMEEKHAEKTASLQLIITGIKNDLQNKIDDHLREESLRTRVEVDLNQTKGQLQDSEEMLKKTQLKLEAAESSLNVSNDALSAAQNLLQKESEDHEEERKKFEKQEEEIKERMKNDQQIREEKIDKLQQEIQIKDKLLKSEQVERATAKENLVSAESRITEHELKLGEANQQFSEITSQKVEIETRLSHEISEHLKNIEKLQEELESSKHEIDEKNSEINEKFESIKKMQDDLTHVRSDLDERTTLLTETEVDLENTRSELDSVKVNLREIETSSKILENEKATLEADADDQTKKINDLEEKLSTSISDYENASETLKMTKQELTKVEDELLLRKLEWEENCEKLRSESNKLEEKVSILQEEIAEEKKDREKERMKGMEEILSMQEKMKEMETSWNGERGVMRGKIESLEAAQNLLISHKLELQKSVETLQTSLDHEKEVAFKDAVKARDELLMKDKSINDVKQQLEGKCRDIETFEAERVVSESRLQLEIGALSENLNSTRAEWVATTQKVDTMARDNDGLRGQVVVLNATVQSNADERRALLERCLNAEQQVEQENTKVSELRRKLEDAQSAMHELGRENQALQVKHTATISRQWTDDRTSNQCKGCGRNFTLTVRKHHCRHCGEIFCAECSSRSATVAASKNPVRVCERCYDDLLVAG